ncbi:MAG: hypothetical protein U5K81_02045 [Trueperaceae bacterium]|nr:hypothetical protein [Trueperaceae bacterium]
MRSYLLNPRFFALALSMTGLVALSLVSCGGPTDEGPPPRPRLTGPTPAELGLATQVDNAVAASVELGNGGTADLTYQVEGLPAWMSGEALTGSIAPGAAATLSLTATLRRC